MSSTTHRLTTFLRRPARITFTLVLLWFGTWKSVSQHYMPEWMKLDPERYAHAVNKNGERVDSPSPFAQASLNADTRAFTTFHAAFESGRPPSEPC